MSRRRSALLSALWVASACATGGAPPGAGDPSPPIPHGQASAGGAVPHSAQATPAPSAAAPAAEPICGIGTESEVADEVLGRSGRGLLWLVLPDAAAAEEGATTRESRARGAEDVKSARALAECLLGHHDAGFEATKSQPHEALEAWVDAHVGPEHAETLLAAGAAYFASILAAESPIDAMFDVPAARLFLERSTAADPRLADGLGPLILGAHECFIPKPVGGQPEQGLHRLQDAAAHSASLHLVMNVVAAELCAFALQDRVLFTHLLDEVQAAGESASPFDIVAKQRAETLRAEMDDMFLD